MPIEAPEANAIAEKVSYKTAIAQLKIWLNGAKTVPSSSSELEGTRTVRSANAGELVRAFALDAATGNLPGAEVKDAAGNIITPATGLAKALDTAGGFIKDTVSAIPFVGSDIGDALSAGAKFVRDPFGATKVGVTEAFSDSKNFVDNYAVQIQLGATAESLGYIDTVKYYTLVTIEKAKDTIESWTNDLLNLKGPSPYSLRDVFDYTDEATKKAMQTVFGVQGFTYSELAGSVLSASAQTKFKEKLDNLNIAMTKDLSDPDNLAEAEQARIEAEQAAEELIAQVEQERANYHQVTATFETMQSQFDMANYYNSLSPEQQQVYLTTIDPNMHEHLTIIADNLGSTGEPVTPSVVGQLG